MDKLLTYILEDDKGAQHARTILGNAHSLLYALAAVIAAQGDYVLAIIAIVIGFALYQIREICKRYQGVVDLKKKRKKK